jgi:hypothetical protein
VIEEYKEMKEDKEETEQERQKARLHDQNLCTVVPCPYTLIGSTIYGNAINCLFKAKERKATPV